MTDYKELYLTRFRATERAIDQLIAVQRQCEDLYLAQEEGSEADSPASEP